MLENLLLWIIIGLAAAYTCRNIYRAIQGKSSGCGCDSSCRGSSKTIPQNKIPDIRRPQDKRSSGK